MARCTSRFTRRFTEATQRRDRLGQRPGAVQLALTRAGGAVVSYLVTGTAAPAAPGAPLDALDQITPAAGLLEGLAAFLPGAAAMGSTGLLTAISRTRRSGFGRLAPFARTRGRVDGTGLYGGGA